MPALAGGVATNRSRSIHTHIDVAGMHLLADAAGALLAENDRVLLVADLHLEKGSSLARRGMLLPPYDTAATLHRLGTLIARYAPRRVVALGDSFHDRRATERLSIADRETLAALQAGRDWLWIAGNHDPEPPAGLWGEIATEWQFGPLLLRHEPQAGMATGEIAGHLHPAAIVAGRGGTVRRRCFVSDGSRCVMPAFGAYAGGLNLHDKAFTALFARGPRIAHALGRDRVYPVPEHRCLPEG
ncbi:ligase-associated DNA damage response endonuclease PdeM [Lichenihabitans psoromatis]|uniref:ligase-associated DNA damage response endonuclease PdeM n=1 Tax=Lichenihabitans psoromatis TaxID=2528642 RepID=UPI003CCB3BAD